MGRRTDFKIWAFPEDYHRILKADCPQHGGALEACADDQCGDGVAVVSVDADGSGQAGVAGLRHAVGGRDSGVA